jgi:hypothetical protein
MRRMLHPPYSPDLTPRDFYLFPTVKEKLERIQVTDEDQYVECLQKILSDIDQKQLKGVWINKILSNEIFISTNDISSRELIRIE